LIKPRTCVVSKVSSKHEHLSIRTVGRSHSVHVFL
jgi:hypothetical protein